VLTRQKLPVLEKADRHWRKSVRSGGYVAEDTDGDPEVTILATGSEVSMAVEAAKRSSRRVRVVSVMDKGAFDAMPAAARAELVPPQSRTVVAEAGVSGDWGLYVGDAADLFTVSRFAESGPGKKVAAHIGFTAETLAELCDAD
jgi:transketolase